MAAWVKSLDDPTVRLPNRQRANVFASWRAGRCWLFSYGSHFPLAVPLAGGAVLLNGDLYSMTTSSHQRLVRDALADRPTVIVPWSAMRGAGVWPETVRLITVEPDRYDFSLVSADCPPRGVVPEVDDVASWGGQAVRRDPRDGRLFVREEWCGEFSAPMSGELMGYTRQWRQAVVKLPNGRYQWHTVTHWLGDSVFTAMRSDGDIGWYISSFDRQESPPLYFLSRLPRESYTIADALEALKPESVATAEMLGRSVSRQGDMFAIPMDVTRRGLQRLGAQFVRRAVSIDVDGRREVSARSLLGTAHTASEVATLPDGAQFARGCLYHYPEIVGQWWRTGDHARRRMGDGKQWHLIARNAVPVQKTGGQSPRQRRAS